MTYDGTAAEVGNQTLLGAPEACTKAIWTRPNKKKYMCLGLPDPT